MAADLFAVVAGLGLRRPALVGLSMGGTIALQYAPDHPGDLSRLVVAGSLAGVPGEFASVRGQQLEFIETHGLRAIAESRMAAAFTASADPAAEARVTEMIAGGDLEGYPSQARAALTFDIRHLLGEIAVPATIIHGELDAVAPAAFATFMGEAISETTVHIIEGQGHFAHLEALERFNPLLADALRIPEDLVPAR
jgi:3-oxoadipate enol-lactonase